MCDKHPTTRLKPNRDKSKSKDKKNQSLVNRFRIKLQNLPISILAILTSTGSPTTTQEKTWDNLSKSLMSQFILLEKAIILKRGLKDRIQTALNLSTKLKKYNREVFLLQTTHQFNPLTQDKGRWDLNSTYLSKAAKKPLVIPINPSKMFLLTNHKEIPFIKLSRPKFQYILLAHLPFNLLLRREDKQVNHAAEARLKFVFLMGRQVSH